MQVHIEIEFNYLAQTECFHCFYILFMRFLMDFKEKMVSDLIKNIKIQNPSMHKITM